ncbi:MAG: site-specific integrase [Deltaproteobacteria bacterium]|nr:site-specific integrase [Deltaproteobacteria bacterium]
MGKRIAPGLYDAGDGYVVRVKVTAVGSLKTTKWKSEKLVGVTKAQALVRLEQLKERARNEAESMARGETSTTTLSAYARLFVEDLGRRVTRGEITKRTADGHTDRLQTFILPVLGAHDVARLTPKDVKGWMRSVEAMKRPSVRRGRGKKTWAQESLPYSKGTLMGAWRVLRAFLAWVTVEADLPRNPAAFVRWDIEANSGNPRVWMTKGEVALLLESAKAEADARLRLMCVVALVGAMRSSEVSALQRSDLDLDHGTATINRSVVHGVFNKPKTKGSRRVVALPSEVVEELRAYLCWQDDNEVKGRPLLFPSSVGTPQTPDTINYALERIAKRAGIAKRITSHVMRRTTNDLVRRAVNDVVARAVTGHVTAEMTEHYSAFDLEEKAAALKSAFGDVFGGLARGNSTGATRDEEGPKVLDG